MEDIEKIIMDLKSKTDCNAQAIDTLNSEVDEMKTDISDIHKLTTSVELMAQSFGTMNGKVDTIGQKVETIETKVQEIETAPLKQKASLWDKAWVKIGSVVGAGVLGYVLAQLFPQIFGNG